MSSLETELKQMIVDVLGLDDVQPQEISSEENLFGDDGLALDSIDALELGVSIQKRYGIKIDTQDKEIKAHFRNVRSLAELIAKSR